MTINETEVRARRDAVAAQIVAGLVIACTDEDAAREMTAHVAAKVSP